MKILDGFFDGERLSTWIKEPDAFETDWSCSAWPRLAFDWFPYNPDGFTSQVFHTRRIYPFFFSILFGIPAASTVVDPPTVSSLPTNQTFASGRSFYHRPPPTNQLVLPLAAIRKQKCHSQTDSLLTRIIMKFLFIENYSFNQSKRINEYHNQQNKWTTAVVQKFTRLLPIKWSLFRCYYVIYHLVT